MKERKNIPGLAPGLQKRKLVLSFLRSYAAVLIVPFLLSLLFYMLSIHEVNESAIRMNNQVLESASNQIELSLMEIENVAHEIVTKPSVRLFQWKSSGFDYPNAYKLIEVRDTLDNYSLTHDIIDQYFLLFNRSGIVMNNNFIYTYEAFFDQYFSLPGMSSEEARNMFVSRSVATGLHASQEVSILEKTNRDLILVEPLYDLADGYLCILINEHDILSLFNSINLGDSGCVYVVNSSGECLLSHNPAEDDFEPLFTASYNRIVSDPSAESFTVKTAGGAMLVNQVHSPNGLVYVSVQPMSIILGRVSIFRHVLLLCFAIALIIGVLLCLWQTHHAVTPVALLMNAVGLDDGNSREALSVIRDMFIDQQSDIQNLQRVVGEHRALLRSSFANRLLQGNFSSEEEALRVAEHVIPEHAAFSTARVLLIHLSGPVISEASETNLKLVGTMKVALRDSLDRFFESPLTCDPDEETLAMIVFDMDYETIEARLRRLLAECSRPLQECMTIAVGRSCHPPFPKLARSFESARIIMTVRLLKSAQDSEKILRADRETGASQFFFPPDIRYRLTESVTHGRVDDVDAILDKLFRVNVSERLLKPTLFRLFVTELLCTGVACLPLLPISFSEDALDEQISSITDASLQRQPKLIHEFFRLLTESAQMESGNSEQIIQQVIKHIAENYSDSSLSLTQLSELFSVNPSTLSTIFKQQTGANISSYIEDVRIKEAMRLLRTTDWTINQISEAVGYLTASTFCRAFRRNTGYNTSTYKSMVGE